MTYSVRLASPATRDLAAVPPRYTAAILEFAFGTLGDNPQRVGKLLGGECDGCHGARRGDYRTIYEIHDESDDVVVVRVSHRAQAYRRR